MPGWAFGFPFLFLIGLLALVALLTMLVRLFVLPLFGVDWISRRVDIPWRFSLRALAILTALAACVFGFLRESISSALIGLGLVATAWIAVVRFCELRQALADRRDKEFNAAIEERRKQQMHGGHHGAR